MSTGEVYPNAPVVLAALEVRHPRTEPLSDASKARLKKYLSHHFPLPRPVTTTMVQGTIGAPQEVRVEESPRFMSRDRTASVTYRQESMGVELTQYGSHHHLLDLATVAIEARQDIAPVDGIERVGLRYVDEIRVPYLSETALSWGDWIDSSLIGPGAVGLSAKLNPTQWQGVTAFDAGDGQGLVLRYGPMNGYAVDPSGDLRRPTPAPGPFFLIDADSFWEPVDEVPEFDVGRLTKIIHSLHTPVSNLFEALITDKLREEVLRRG